MNERIFELARQVWPDPNISHVNHMKFAELLIRECLDVISDESEKVSDEWRCKDGKHIWWKIKEHFGGQS